jgi:hypothetical protein
MNAWLHLKRAWHRWRWSQHVLWECSAGDSEPFEAGCGTMAADLTPRPHNDCEVGWRLAAAYVLAGAGSG